MDFAMSLSSHRDQCFALHPDGDSTQRAQTTLKPLPNEEGPKLYDGMQHIPLYQMTDFYGKSPSLRQLVDIFLFLK